MAGERRGEQAVTSGKAAEIGRRGEAGHGLEAPAAIDDVAGLERLVLVSDRRRVGGPADQELGVVNEAFPPGLGQPVEEIELGAPAGSAAAAGR